ncbi:hypothetical protein KVT40_005738 [Elsinoe batatas]|uniref:Uncharacterized protein n=1 Tax=Elsinoe batatas TaxID=2601811 RepID=A0A8K0L248_9PEZI|nr:hypothetical protein KVT40_005738 [Elsinoe batatas]
MNDHCSFSNVPGSHGIHNRGYKPDGYWNYTYRQWKWINDIYSEHTNDEDELSYRAAVWIVGNDHQGAAAIIRRCYEYGAVNGGPPDPQVLETIHEIIQMSDRAHDTVRNTHRQHRLLSTDVEKTQNEYPDLSVIDVPFLRLPRRSLQPRQELQLPPPPPTQDLPPAATEGLPTSSSRGTAGHGDPLPPPAGSSTLSPITQLPLSTPPAAPQPAPTTGRTQAPPHYNTHPNAPGPYGFYPPPGTYHPHYTPYFGHYYSQTSPPYM